MPQLFKSSLKWCLQYPLGILGAFPTKLSHVQDVRRLITSLRPIKCDKRLIRLGPQGDGGYLIPDDLQGIGACFSPGVSSKSGFEEDCADLGIKVFLADKSVDSPAVEHELFDFQKKYVGAVSNDDTMTLDSWVESSIPDTVYDLILQIDIEGHEYEAILPTTDELMHRFRIIVGEFHDLDVLWSAPFYRLAAGTFQKILQTHTCVHLHPNNYPGSLSKGGLEIPRLMEFTFLRKDRVANASYQTKFPHLLDRDNAAGRSLPLPRCWYSVLP